MVVMAVILPLKSSAEAISIYLLKSSVSWDYVNLYKWYNDGQKDVTIGNSWPGDKLTETETIDGEEYYVYTFGQGYTKVNIIFNGGDDSNKTGDINNIIETTYYELSSDNKNEALKFPEKLANPSISVDRNIVTITTSEIGKVYYTLDGSEPNRSSNVYDKPFELTKDTHIRAIQMRGSSKSDIVEHLYIATTGGKHYVYYAAEQNNVNPVEVCITDEAYLPIEGGSRVDDQPDVLYLQGNINGFSWDANKGLALKRYGVCFVSDDVTFNDSGNGHAYFSFATKLGENKDDWDGVNKGDRYGAEGKDVPEEENVKFKMIKYSTGNNSANCKSWQIAAGTYSIVVDFSTNDVLVTKKPSPTPAWQDMALTSVEVDRVGYEGKNLYRVDAPANAKIGFRQGESAINAGVIVSDGDSYIYNGSSMVKCDEVSVGFFNVENDLYTSSSFIEASEDASNVKYTVNGHVAEVGSDGKIDVTGVDANALLNIDWAATNGQGLTYYGSTKLINHPDNASTVKVFAILPTGWSGMSYSIVSDLDNTQTAGGEFATKEGDYYVITVPSHLVHSTIVFSNTGAAQQSAKKRAAAQTIEKKLAGKTMYLSNDGEYWDVVAPDTSGIEVVNVDAELPVEYYNLQGVRVAAPTRGVYIKRQGSTVTKVVM